MNKQQKQYLIYAGFAVLAFGLYAIRNPKPTGGASPMVDNLAGGVGNLIGNTPIIGNAVTDALTTDSGDSSDELVGMMGYPEILPYPKDPDKNIYPEQPTDISDSQNPPQPIEGADLFEPAVIDETLYRDGFTHFTRLK